MENDWIKVYTTGKMFTAELVKGMLAEQGIECTIMNQKDSEFLFGEISLFVSASDETKAKKLINEHNKAE